ncbi:MAG: CDP-alcohol phosphatidyltransferase family protein [candidate division WOR-3 bacterium]|nr:MAG: CDP-alcohol phosphatidyltransferase family protein [candidate division WOR-3 bacterium]
MKNKSSFTMTISNYITLSRIVFLPFIIYFLVTDQRVIAFIILFISLLSDMFDGFLARRLNQESETGKMLDPLCDKISLIAILVTLFIIGSLPLWGLIIIIARDVLILTGSMILWKNKNKIFASNSFGKITGFLYGAVICAFTLGWQILGTIILYLCIPAIIGSFIIYLNRYVRTMKGEYAG